MIAFLRAGPSAMAVARQAGEGRLVVCALGLDRSLAEAAHLLARMCKCIGGVELTEAPVLSEESAARLVAATALP